MYTEMTKVINGIFHGIASIYIFPGLQKCYFNSFVTYTGIGQGRVTTNLKGAPIDDAVFVTDKEAVEMVRQSVICWYARLLNKF